MKTLILSLLMLMLLMVGSTPCSRAEGIAGNKIEASAQGCVEIKGPVTVETTLDTPMEAPKGNFFSDNWGELFLGLLRFYDLVARLTPTKKDNSVVNFLTMLYNAIIPNLKKGGGIL